MSLQVQSVRTRVSKLVMRWEGREGSILHIIIIVSLRPRRFIIYSKAKLSNQIINNNC